MDLGSKISSFLYDRGIDSEEKLTEIVNNVVNGNIRPEYDIILEKQVVNYVRKLQDEAMKNKVKEFDLQLSIPNVLITVKSDFAKEYWANKFAEAYINFLLTNTK